jgi:hypothetical protein
MLLEGFKSPLGAFSQPGYYFHKPSITDWVLNGIFSGEKWVVLQWFQKRAFIED